MPEPNLQTAYVTLAVEPSADEADALLARAARGEAAEWPAEWRGKGPGAIMSDRVDYHGMSGVLIEGTNLLGSWPSDLRKAIAERATGAAMWEIRHRLLLAEMTSALASAGVDACLLKGSALAYAFYPNPAVRERGDSDLLIDGAQRSAARRTLTGLGFSRLPGNLWPEQQLYQELWVRRFEDGSSHYIDLHFDLLNSPALANLVTMSDCFSHRLSLSGIGPHAWAPGRAVLLFHALIHREINRVARYFVRNRETTGGDRLIWLMDIDLLARSMTDEEWKRFTGLAARTRQSAACIAGMKAAVNWLGTPVPESAAADLNRGRRRSSAYLRRGQFARAIADVAAVPGIAAKIRYGLARMFPNENAIRAKYDDGANRSIATLYARRLRDAAMRAKRAATR